MNKETKSALEELEDFFDASSVMSEWCSTGYSCSSTGHLLYTARLTRQELKSYKTMLDKLRASLEGAQQ